MIDYISIIDDDPITVFGIKKMLDISVDCNMVDTYSNGKSALENIMARLGGNNSLPQIIFLDINMPIMDGWQFLEEFIKLPIQQRVRVNIVTSSIDPYDMNQWQKFKKRTHHLITFNHKPIKKQDIAAIAKVA